MCVVDEDHQLLIEKVVLRERCFECVFYLNLNKVHHSMKITTSPLNDMYFFFLVAGVIWTYLLSPAQKMTRKGPVYLAYLILQGMVMNRNSADGKTTWYFSVSLMQTFHYGQLMLLLAHIFLKCMWILKNYIWYFATKLHVLSMKPLKIYFHISKL